MKLVNDALKAKGIITWFDGDRMKGNVAMQMAEGIEHSLCIVVFLTKRYESKVGGSNAGDNCQIEFLYASKKKTADKMVSFIYSNH